MRQSCRRTTCKVRDNDAGVRIATHDVDDLRVSPVMVLRPGDVINTGTRPASRSAVEASLEPDFWPSSMKP